MISIITTILIENQSKNMDSHKLQSTIPNNHLFVNSGVILISDFNSKKLNFLVRLITSSAFMTFNDFWVLLNYSMSRSYT